MDLCLCIAASHPRPLDERVAELAACGIPCLEVTWLGFPHWDVRRCGRIREALAEQGLRMRSIHAPFGTELNVLDRDPGLRLHALEAHLHMLPAVAALGAHVFVMHPGREFKSGRPYSELIDSGVDAVSQVTVRAAELGVEVALENVLPAHALGSHESIVEVVDRADHPSLGICLDTGHANVVSTVEDALQHFGSRINHVHLHDNNGRSDEHLCPGLGSIDWPPVLEGLKRVGFEGPLTLECRPPPDIPPEAIRGFVLAALGLSG